MDMGKEYQVALAGNRTAWAAPEHLRLIATQQKPDAPVSGQRSNHGMVSCGGKVEGRYYLRKSTLFFIVFR
jgi:hypothetical protein